MLYSILDSQNIIFGRYVMTALFIIIALFGLASFWGATSEKPALRFFHHINPLRKLGEHYPKVFGLPIFVMAIAIPFPLTRYFVDVSLGFFFLAAGYAYISWLDTVTKKDETSPEK